MKKLVDIEIDQDLIKWLVDSGRLPYPQRADPFAITKVVDQLFKDIQDGKEEARHVIGRIQRVYREP